MLENLGSENLILQSLKQPDIKLDERLQRYPTPRSGMLYSRSGMLYSKYAQVTQEAPW